MRILASFLFLTATTAVAEMPDFSGLYRVPQPFLFPNWDCKRIGEMGGAIQITGTFIDGVGQDCELRNPRSGPTSDDVTYDALCTGGNYTWEQTKVFRRSGRDLTIFNPDGLNDVLERCPE